MLLCSQITLMRDWDGDGEWDGIGGDWRGLGWVLLGMRDGVVGWDCVGVEGRARVMVDGRGEGALIVGGVCERWCM